MNPAALMKIMGLKNKFESEHPRFAAFIGDLFKMGVTEGTVIEITLTRPDGSTATTNMKVKPSDIELVNELKNLKPM